MASRSQPATLSRSLTAVAVVLVLVYLVQLPPLLLSLRLPSAAGGSDLAVVLSRNAALPLLAVTLQHLALGLSPDDGAQARRARRASLACTLISLGFLALLVVQGAALTRHDNGLAADLERREFRLQDRYQRLRQVVRDADSLPELRQGLRQLQGPPVPQSFPGTPLPAIRARMLQALDRSEPYVRQRLMQRWREEYQSAAVIEGLSQMLPSLIYALGFAIFAQLPWSEQTLLEAVRSGRQSSVTPEADPAPPQPRVRSLEEREIGDYLEQLAEESERALHPSDQDPDQPPG